MGQIDVHKGIGEGNINLPLPEHFNMLRKRIRIDLTDRHAGLFGEVFHQTMVALEGLGVGVLGEVGVGNRRSLWFGRNFLTLVQGYLDSLLVTAPAEKGCQQHHQQQQSIEYGRHSGCDTLRMEVFLGVAPGGPVQHVQPHTMHGGKQLRGTCDYTLLAPVLKEKIGQMESMRGPQPYPRASRSSSLKPIRWAISCTTVISISSINSSRLEQAASKGSW